MTLKKVSTAHFTAHFVDRINQGAGVSVEADLAVESEGAVAFVALSWERYRELRALERSAFKVEDIPEAWFDQLGNVVHSNDAMRLNSERE